MTPLVAAVPDTVFEARHPVNGPFELATSATTTAVEAMSSGTATAATTSNLVPLKRPNLPA
jgi:hypothetical protein